MGGERGAGGGIGAGGGECVVERAFEAWAGAHGWGAGQRPMVLERRGELRNASCWAAARSSAVAAGMWRRLIGDGGVRSGRGFKGTEGNFAIGAEKCETGYGPKDFSASSFSVQRALNDIRGHGFVG